MGCHSQQRKDERDHNSSSGMQASDKAEAGSETSFLVVVVAICYYLLVVNDGQWVVNGGQWAVSGGFEARGDHELRNDCAVMSDHEVTIEHKASNNYQEKNDHKEKRFGKIRADIIKRSCVHKLALNEMSNYL